MLSVFCLAITLGLGCVSPSVSDWGSSIPEAELEAALASLPLTARRQLRPLSEIFYQQITSRRFNSRATFEDPSIRQFFPALAAYSDYYAALVDALDRAHIQYTRPTRVALIGIERIAGDSVSLELRFVGENDLPLRWWTASLERKDQWQWREGRWWVVPGKV